MFRSTVGKSFFALALLLSLSGFARTVEVTSCTNGVVSLAFGEADGKAYRLMVGRGALDAGSDLAAWEAFEEIGTVATDATSLTYAFPEGEHRFARFFLVAAEQPVVKRLVYIQSSGSQYIDTGVRARTPVRAVLDLATVGVSEDKTILGARKNTGDTRFFLAHRYKMSDNHAYVVQAVNAWGGYIGQKVRDKNRYQHFESYIGTPERTLVVRDADGTVSKSTVSTSIDTGLNLYLFAANMYGSPGQFANVRIYGCKIWLDDVLQRDFYPAEDSSGAAGLYDAVSHTFFKNQGSGTFTKGPEIAFESRIFPVAAASDVVTIRALGALVGKWDFGAGAQNVLPLPAGVLENSPWTMKFRFRAPGSGSGKRTIFKLDGADGAEDEMFVDGAGKIGYGSTSTTFAVTADVWHTLAVSGGPGRWDAYLDEQRIAFRNGDATTFFNGHASVLLGTAIDFSSVAIWKEGGAGEARLEQFTKDGLTGEWTFPAMNPLRATKGRDLERCNLTYDGTFTETSFADGTVLGDTGMRLPTYQGYRCHHGLPLDASYSVVMDVRIHSDDDMGKLRAVFQPNPYHSTDSCFFLRANAGQAALEAWVASGTWKAAGCDVNTWARCVLTYKHGGNKTLYINGQKIDVRAFERMKVTGDSFYFGLDNNTWGGTIEDYAIDLGYAAIYNRVLTDAEVAELHSRPTAHTGSTDTTVPTVSPVGVWEKEEGALVARQGEALTALGNGAYSWTRSTAPAAATYVADLTLPLEQTAGGTFVANANGVATGIYGTAGLLSGSFVTTTDASIFAPGTDWTGSADWGYWTYQPLQRGEPVRVAVVWSAAGHVTYYENGRLRAQLEPTAAGSLATPTRTMTFFTGLGADVTRLVAYDTALTPFEIASLGVLDITPVENAAPVAAIAPRALDEYSVLDPVPFTTSFTDEDGDWAMIEIDYGDGTVERSPAFVMPGQEVTLSHLYSQVGTYTPRVRAVSQNGQTGAWASGTPITLKFTAMNVDNLLITRPWQQNVYTNRFTIMVEMNREVAGLQLQYGESYTQMVAMTGICASAGNTWIYKGRVTLNGHPGETIPYRLGQAGMPFTGTRAPELEGMVKLWPMDDNESFSCSVWGDNQEGARAGDWDVAPYLYVTRLFEHMMARDVDFGLCTGDMASSANYATQIKPLVLDRTDVIFGSTKPYYVAWGNHDTAHSDNKPYFETPAIDDPSSRTSEKGNSYLYRGNVLFILLDDSVCQAPATKTWLANLLETSRARAAKFRIVLHHQPIYTEVSGSMLRDLEQTFINGGVDLVLGGHMHGYERLFFSGVTYVVNGCAGYLDHPLSVVHNWGDASVVGGHRDVPFLWARQSVADHNVLGAAEPVRMGMLMGYGELTFKGNELIYRAFGFNADGSYIGVFDAFRLTSKTVAASTTQVGNAPVCANPASFAEFTTKPVTNAKWKEYADAVGLAFTYPEGTADAPVTDVSKTEIEAFLAWLNGSTGTYRLPTVEELAVAFDGNFAREISEWTSTVDAARGRCRILGGPACAVPGTWTRPTDRPEMLSADCSATYLGFRLATGSAPAEPDTLAAAAAAALALDSGDTCAYKWENGQLVSIADIWFATHSSALTFDVPVVLTGTGTLEYNSNKALTLNGGLVMPKATGFTKRGTGALTIRGPVRVGPTIGSSAAELAGFVFTSNGSLTLDGVTFTGTAAAFRTANKTLYLAGTNDFSSAALAFNASSVTDLALASGARAASLAVRSMRQYAENASASYGIGAGVTVTCAEDVKVAQALYVIDGKLDTGAVNATGNNGPYFQGTGTLALGYLGSFQNSWTRWELANVVFTTARPIRNNKASSRNRHQVEGVSTRFAATCDWSVWPSDELNMPVEWGSELLRTTSPRLVFDTLDPLDGTTAHTFEFLPNLASGTWGFTKVNPGTLVLKGAYGNTGAIRVEGGVLRLVGKTSLAASDFSVGPEGTLELAGTSTVATVVFAGGTLAPQRGAGFVGSLQGPYTVAEPAGEVLSLAFGSLFTGKATLADGTSKFRLSYALDGRAALGVAYPVLAESALTAEQVEVTADLDPMRFTSVTCVNRAGDVDLVVMPVEARAAWGDDAVSIFGTFTPQDSYRARFELQDGATLDLREKTAVWPVEGTGTHTTPLAFADNATITIDVTGRDFTTDEKVVSWTAAPENLSTLKFRFKTTSSYMSNPRITADGIWVRHFKQLIIFR